MVAYPAYAEWRNYFPFYRQADVDDAITLFKEIEDESAANGDVLRQARAMAWRAYGTLTALQEWWEIKNWGSQEQNYNRNQLAQYAHDLAQAAKSLTSPADFDTLWAFAFAKMYRRSADADDLVQRAIHRARLQSETNIPDDQLTPGQREELEYARLSISSLLAEAADIFIYQGELDRALASIFEGLYLDAREGRQSADWCHWMRALAIFNKGLLIESVADGLPPGPDKAAMQNRADRQYVQAKRIIRTEFTRSESNHRYEFDALRVLAAAHYKLNEGNDQAEVIARFKRKLRNRKPDWTRHKERDRLKYVSGPAGSNPAVLQAKWVDIADALFPGP